MGLRTAIICLLFVCYLSACSTPAPTWRAKSYALVDELAKLNAVKEFPQEYLSLLETFEHGEAVLLVQGNEIEADVFYSMALKKGEVLKDEFAKLKLRKAQEEQARIAAEAVRLEEERLMREATEAEARLHEQELRTAAQTTVKIETPKDIPQQKLLTYTVRRAETLPQIAGRTEIYNDSSLWPLIYRANRDQIRDPKQLWPGQILKIPRHFSRDEVIEAKRFSGKK